MDGVGHRLRANTLHPTTTRDTHRLASLLKRFGLLRYHPLQMLHDGQLAGQFRPPSASSAVAVPTLPSIGPHVAIRRSGRRQTVIEEARPEPVTSCTAVVIHTATVVAATCLIIADTRSRRHQSRLQRVYPLVQRVHKVGVVLLLQLQLLRGLAGSGVGGSRQRPRVSRSSSLTHQRSHQFVGRLLHTHGVGAAATVRAFLSRALSCGCAATLVTWS